MQQCVTFCYEHTVGESSGSWLQPGGQQSHVCRSLMHALVLAACSYIYDQNNRPQKRPPPEESKSRAAWKSLYGGVNLDTEDVKWRQELRQSIMKGEVLPHIENVSPLGQWTHPRQRSEPHGLALECGVPTMPYTDTPAVNLPTLSADTAAQGTANDPTAATAKHGPHQRRRRCCISRRAPSEVSESGCRETAWPVAVCNTVSPTKLSLCSCTSIQPLSTW
jgi:hypothetical protein